MITSSWHMNPDTNPARPGTNKGPGWAPTPNDGLQITDGRRVGDVDTPELYREFDRLKVPGFNHSLGRAQAIELFARMLSNFRERAGDAALSAYLQANK